MDARPHSRRVLAIGLDGYEASLGDKLMAAGELPSLARLRSHSARFLLDHGPAQRTGLAWEHVSTGRSPQAADRWSTVSFDSSSYEVWQEGTSLEPFPARLQAPTVVFDPPYFDLNLAPATRGVVNWGAHDPGIEPDARPKSLDAELERRFGPYAAKEWIYGIVWQSAKRAREMGDGLVRATDLRAEVAGWLLRERLRDWQLGIVVAGELHSANEGLWHGVDPTHPLHQWPSAAPAGEGLRAVYVAVDRLVGKLTESFSDATVVAFSMGGMGPNRSDIASMVLLPELLYRHSFREPLMCEPEAWANATGCTPKLDEDENWSAAVNARIPQRYQPDFAQNGRSHHSLIRLLKRAMGRTTEQYQRGAKRALRDAVRWMPATHYQPYWHAMPFFALPSFYDGRIRVNLIGRERDGKVPPSQYAAVCDEIEDIVRACRDCVTGEAVVDYVERCGDFNRLGPTEADLVVVWRGTATGFDHPLLGRVGPVPFRRPGGHTGRFGMAYISGEGVIPGEFGVRSSFDVVPTIINLLGERLPSGLDGCSLLTGDAVYRSKISTR